MTRLQRTVLIIALTFILQSIALAQSQPGAGSRRSFTLYGDIKVDTSQVSAHEANRTFDIILYTRGNEVFSRQRTSNGGRYQFNNIFNGDYYLSVELDSVEIARMPILIPANSVEYIRHDLAFRWKPIVPRVSETAPADDYNRSGQTKSLYQRASQEIESKNFTQAIATLRSAVEADPKDYPAWTNLGMIYFIQKDLENAEKSYVSAISAKADHVPALVSLGRVRLARKNNEGAVESLETALKTDANSAQANYFLGEAYLALKKGSKAVGYLNEALRLDPMGMADAHLRLGSLYNLAGYKDRAAAEYEQFLLKKPDYPEKQKLAEYIQANKLKTEAPKP